MRLRKFRVQGFRCIRDSGYVALKDLAVLVGKNESGKTALLSALLHLNKDKPLRPLDINEEMNDELSSDAVIVEGEFELDTSEQAVLAALNPQLPAIAIVRVRRKRSGAELLLDFPGVVFPDVYNLSNKLVKRLSAILDPVAAIQLPDGTEMSPDMRESIESLRSKVQRLKSWQHSESEDSAPILETMKRDLTTLNANSDMLAEVGTILGSLWTRLDLQKSVTEKVLAELYPRFVYFSDYKIIEGAIDLRSYAGQPATASSPSDTGFKADTKATVDNLFYLAEVDVEELRAAKEDPLEYSRLLRISSSRLTKKMADTWLLQKIDVQLKAHDGDVVIVEVSDLHENGDRKNTGWLGRRAQGFKWHFSFFVNFNAETKRAALKEAILLLDEPGLHLHPAQQEGLVEVIRRLASGNQIVYSTHSPFMICSYDIGSLLIVSLDKETKQSTIETQFWKCDALSLLPILHSLGGRILRDFGGRTRSAPLAIVEGVTDIRYLVEMRDSCRKKLSEKRASQLETVALMPGNGCTGIGPLAKYHREKGFNVVAMYDSDPAGRAEAAKLEQELGFPKDKIMLLEVGSRRELDIEDLFTTTDYLENVNEFYASRLLKAGFKSIARKDVDAARKAIGTSRIVPGLERLFEDHAKDNWGRFDKVAVCEFMCGRMMAGDWTPTADSVKRFADQFGRLAEVFYGTETEGQPAASSART